VSWQDDPVTDNIGKPPAQVPVGKSQGGVLGALAMSDTDRASDAQIEAMPGMRAEYDKSVGRLKPPRSAAEAAAQSDMLSDPPPDPGAAPAGGNPWDSDPLVSPASGSGPAHTIPQADAGIHVPASTSRPPAPPSTLPQKVMGGIEAGMNIITSLTTGALTAAGGFIGGVAGAAATGQLGTQEGVQNIQQATAEGQAKGTYPPTTPTGQEYAENAGDVLNAALPVFGHMGEIGAVHAGAAPAAQAVGDVARAGGAAVADTAAAAGRAVAKGAGKVVGVDPELVKVAQIAQELPYPIKVAPDQLTTGKFTKLVGQTSREVPLSGSSTDANAEAFTRNAIALINPDETARRLTGVTYDDAMNRSGQGIGDIAAKTPVPLEDINAQLETLRDHVNAKHSDETTKPINAYIDELQAKADDNGMIDGTALKNINSEIGERARQEADKPLGGQLNDLQSIIQDGVEKNIADPAEVQQLRDYRRQYAYGKILEPIVAKTVTGLVSPASLMGAVTRTGLGKYLMARAKGGPIGDLAKVGQILKEPGSSMTAERGLVYAGLGGMATVEPHTAAAVYTGANLYNRLGPKVTRAMVGKRAAPAAEAGPEVPPEPTTSPGAGGPTGGGAPPAGPGPLGDLTPEWGTTPGAGGGAPRGGHEPGLVPPIDETPPTTGNRKAPLQMPAVPGRPDLPDTMVSGGPAESAATEPANAAMHEPGAIEARRQQEAAANPEAAKAPAQGPGIAEAQRMLGENPSPEARKVLEDHITAAKKTQSDRAAQEAQDAKAAQLERTARETTDPVIQKKLLAEADKLRGTERIPIGATKEGQPEIPSGAPTKPLPVGKTIEGEPAAEKVPVGKATEREMTPQEESEWRKQFGLGAEDAQRAKDVAQALKHDPQAVEAAAVQHENQPRAFDRVIADINEKGEASANEAKPAAEGSEGNSNGPAGAAGTGGAPVRSGEGAEGVRGGSVADRGSTRGEAGAGDNAVPAAAAGAGANAKPEPGAAVRGPAEQPGANGVPAAGRGGVPAAGKGGQGAGGEEGPGAAGLKGATNDTANKPGDAGDLRGAGQEAKGPLEDEAFKGGEEPDQNGQRTPEAGLGQVEKPKPFGTAGAMDKALREQLGNKLIDGLKSRGLLKYSTSTAEGKQGAGAIMRQPNADIANHENTAATLYYDALHEGNVAGVLMHELGEHFGIIRVLGTQRYTAMLSDLKSLKDTPEVAEAWAHVEKNYVGPDTLTKYESMDNVNALREVAARLVETHPDLPFVRRLISEIRAFFYEHFGTTLGNTVDADLIRGLAASALRKAGEGKLIGQKPLVPRGAAPPAPKPFVPPKVTPRSDGFPPLYQ
jgi:hypothetical protein